MPFPGLRTLRTELDAISRVTGAKFTDGLAWRLAGRTMTETQLCETVCALAKAQHLSRDQMRVLGELFPRICRAVMNTAA